MNLINPAVALRLPKVGDVLHSSWGYDQTNATFYLVTKVSAARVTLRELRNIETPDEKISLYGKAVPDLNSNAGRDIVKGFRPDHMGEGYYVRVSSYAGAFLWDGKPAEVSHTH
jgi:hypothetical protein